MAGKMARPSQKKMPRPLELMPQHLDWFMENGLDLRLFFSSANSHFRKATDLSKTLDKGKLKKKEELMDRYLFSCRSAASINWKIANGLRERRNEFLKANPRVSPAGYDALVGSIESHARRCETISTKYEKQYEKRHGEKRAPYGAIMIDTQEKRELVRSAIYASLEKLGLRRGIESTAVARKSRTPKPSSRNLPGARKGTGEPLETAELTAEIAKLKEERKKLKEVASFPGVKERDVAGEIRELTLEINRLRKQRESKGT